MANILDKAKRLAPITEPVAVTDVFASGSLAAEDIGGGCLRFTLYANQRSPFTGDPERVIVARIVMPAQAARQMTDVFGTAAVLTADLDGAMAVSPSAH